MNHKTRSVSGIEFYDFVETLDKCGWAYSDFWEVRNPQTGETGYRYVLEKYPWYHPTLSFEILTERLRGVANDQSKIVFSEVQYLYAPEIKHHTITIMN